MSDAMIDIPSLTDALTHSLTHSFIHCFIHSFRRLIEETHRTYGRIDSLYYVAGQGMFAQRHSSPAAVDRFVHN